MTGEPPDGGRDRPLPWWRELRGLPPGTMESFERTLTRREIIVFRLRAAVFIVIAVAGIAAGSAGAVGGALAAGVVGGALVPLFVAWVWMSLEQRAAVLGRG